MMLRWISGAAQIVSKREEEEQRLELRDRVIRSPSPHARQRASRRRPYRLRTCPSMPRTSNREFHGRAVASDQNILLHAPRARRRGCC